MENNERKKNKLISLLKEEVEMVSFCKKIHTVLWLLTIPLILVIAPVILFGALTKTLSVFGFILFSFMAFVAKRNKSVQEYSLYRIAEIKMDIDSLKK